MKTLLPSLLMALAMGTLFSCKKKSSDNTNNPAPTAGFTYTVTNAGANTTYTADSAFWSTGAWGTGVRAFKGGNMVLEINWSGNGNTAAGPKALGMAVDFTYISGPDYYTPTAPDTLTVTQFAGNLMDGQFDVAVTSTTGPASLTNVSGTFSGLTQN